MYNCMGHTNTICNCTLLSVDDEQRIALGSDRHILVTGTGELAREQVNTNLENTTAIISFPTSMYTFYINSHTVAQLLC